MQAIIYRGNCFKLEWYAGENSRSQALKFYEAQTLKDRIAIMKLFKRIGDSGLIKDKTKFRYEGDGLFAFKANSARYLCFFYQNRKIIITNAFVKKQQKLPRSEKNKAFRYHADYVNRVAKGIYYDKQEVINI